jgi:hypothetical protein
LGFLRANVKKSEVLGKMGSKGKVAFLDTEFEGGKYLKVASYKPRHAKISPM